MSFQNLNENNDCDAVGRECGLSLTSSQSVVVNINVGTSARSLYIEYTIFGRRSSGGGNLVSRTEYFVSVPANDANQVMNFDSGFSSPNHSFPGGGIFRVAFPSSNSGTVCCCICVKDELQQIKASDITCSVVTSGGGDD